jgi:hypothetical protein
MNILILIHGVLGWSVRFVGPHTEEVQDLFGTDTIPTPFTHLARPEIVKAEIERLNPGCVVRFA